MLAPNRESIPWESSRLKRDIHHSRNLALIRYASSQRCLHRHHSHKLQAYQVNSCKYDTLFQVHNSMLRTIFLETLVFTCNSFGDMIIQRMQLLWFTQALRVSATLVRLHNTAQRQKLNSDFEDASLISLIGHEQLAYLHPVYPICSGSCAHCTVWDDSVVVFLLESQLHGKNSINTLI